jgi:hypothetical protein
VSSGIDLKKDLRIHPGTWPQMEFGRKNFGNVQLGCGNEPFPASLAIDIRQIKNLEEEHETLF